MENQNRIRRIVLAYPFAIFTIALTLNVICFGGQALSPSIPSIHGIQALAIAAILLVINHSWLMTSTELTRIRYGLPTTPQEWGESGKNRNSVDPDGLMELQTRHNAHRNATENTVLFIVLAAVFSVASPPTSAIYTWVCMFPLARLGYTLSYLRGSVQMRGAFMSMSLLSMYAITSYLLMGLLYAI